MAAKDLLLKNQMFFVKYLPLSAVIFLFAYLLAPSSKALNNSFYVLVLAPTILIINKIEWKNLWRSQHFKVFSVFCLWALLSILWAEEGKIKEGKYVLYVYLYVLAVTFAFSNKIKLSDKVFYFSIALTASIPVYVLLTAPDKARLKDGHGMFQSALTGGNTLCFFIICCLLSILL